MSENISKFTSKFTIKIYETLKSYEYRRKLSISVEKFKHIIGAIEPRLVKTENGMEYVAFDRYIKYGGFNQKVLSVAIEDINNFSDIYVEYVGYAKFGKEYDTIDFVIKENTNKLVPKIGIVEKKRVVIPKDKKPLVDQLKEFMPKSTKNKEYLRLLELANDDVEKIRQMFNYTQNKDSKKKVRNIYKYMIKGLEDNWLISNAQIPSNKPLNEKDDKVIDYEQISLNLGKIEAYTPNSRNKACNYPQRNYNKQQLSDLEQLLLSK